MRHESVLHRLIEPADYVRSHHALTAHVALVSVLVVALFAFVQRDITRTGEILLLLTTLASAPLVLRGNPRAWQYLLLIGFSAWMFYVDAFHHIDFARADDPLSFHRSYVKVYLFLLAGWWLGGRERNARLLLLCGALGVLARPVFLTDPGDWQRLLAGARFAFGYHNSQHAGVLLGAILLGLLCFAGERLAGRSGRRKTTPGEAAAWIAAILLTVFAVGATHSRQVWVGLGAAAAVVLPAAIHLTWRDRIPGRGRAPVASASLALAAVLAVAALNPLEGAWQRTQEEWGSISAVLHGDEPRKVESGAVRLLQWRFALEHIAQRPLTGHGGGATEILLQASDLPSGARVGFGHVHNAYLELWLAYGLPALLAFLAAMAVVLHCAWTGYRSGCMSPALAVFGLGWVAYFAAVNLFESYVNYDTAYIMMTVVGGALYGTVSLRNPGGTGPGLRPRGPG